ncbi:MAG: geranylgeranylglyceryl/heptaprenylglyceryl phosphate synthase [Melioribacteraceae bacterium]|nr:geranylgeranylglyceryl/heptaprenylglyceryl phosphate synthase [Melioribacteraceae bacterium]
MKVYEKIESIIEAKGAAYFILIDPDDIDLESLSMFVKHCEDSGVDGFLVGGSLMINGYFNKFIETIKNNCSLPVVLFPGNVNQLSPSVDALLYISLISGRNPEYLIGQHVLAAPIIKQYKMEAISTGYILINSGKTTTVEYISDTKPIPANKPSIALATALAGKYMGMKMLYLEAGSGAAEAVPNDTIKLISDECGIPLIVGGGIKDSYTAREKVLNGASVVITGNYFENKSNWNKIKEFADAVHINESKLV